MVYCYEQRDADSIMVYCYEQSHSVISRCIWSQTTWHWQYHGVLLWTTWRGQYHGVLLWTISQRNITVYNYGHGQRDTDSTMAYCYGQSHSLISRYVWSWTTWRWQYHSLLSRPKQHRQSHCISVPCVHRPCITAHCSKLWWSRSVCSGQRERGAFYGPLIGR